MNFLLISPFYSDKSVIITFFKDAYPQGLLESKSDTLKTLQHLHYHFGQSENLKIDCLELFIFNILTYSPIMRGNLNIYIYYMISYPLHRVENNFSYRHWLVLLP